MGEYADMEIDRMIGGGGLGWGALPPPRRRLLRLRENQPALR